MNIDLCNPQQLVYWSKKWEICPVQIMAAFNAIQTSNVEKVREYLRAKGFSL